MHAVLYLLLHIGVLGVYPPLPPHHSNCLPPFPPLSSPPPILDPFFICLLLFQDREEDVRSCRLHTATRCGTATAFVSSVFVCASYGIHTSFTIHAYKPQSFHVQALGSKRKMHDGPNIPQQPAPLPSEPYILLRLSLISF